MAVRICVLARKNACFAKFWRTWTCVYVWTNISVKRFNSMENVPRRWFNAVVSSSLKLFVSNAPAKKCVSAETLVTAMRSRWICQFYASSSFPLFANSFTKFLARFVENLILLNLRNAIPTFNCVWSNGRRESWITFHNNLIKVDLKTAKQR